MSSLSLFFCLILVCIPGILVAVPGAVRRLANMAQERLPAGSEMPPARVMALASAVQSLFLVAIAAATGTAARPWTGLDAPFFEALASGAPLWPAIRPQLGPSLALGVSGALLFVAAYYGLFRPRLDPGTACCMDELRIGLGIGGRVLYGGIVEEVLARWGLMSLLVWLGSLWAGTPAPVVIWGAIVISGVLFGLGHAPGYLAAGCRKSPMLLGTMLSLNLWGSLIFGWLFVQCGLLAAMVAHALFHLIWLPFDLVQRQVNVRETAAQTDPTCGIIRHRAGH